MGSSGAGCLAPEQCTFTFASAYGGSKFIYQAQGMVDFPGLGVPLIDQSIITPGGAQDAMVFSPGDQVHVSITPPTAAPRGPWGKTEPAHTVEYRWHQGTKSIMTGREIIGEFGEVIESWAPNMLLGEDQKVSHQVRYITEDRPALLWYTALPTGPVRPGTIYQETLPAPQLLPGLAAGQLSNFTLAIDAIHMKDGTCTAFVSALVDRVSYPYDPTEYRMEFKNGIPLPAAYSTDFGAGSGSMKLSSWTDGSRDPMPRYQGTTQAPVSDVLKRTTPYGFPEHEKPSMPFPLSRALEILLSDSSAGAWLSSAPEPRASYMLHILGDDRDGIAARWELFWLDANGESKAFHVEQLSRWLPVVESEYRVIEVNQRTMPGGPGPATLPSIGWLVKQYSIIAGEPPEILRCTFLEAVCTAGTHESTRRPKASLAGGGAQQIHPDMVFNLADGAATQRFYLDGPVR